MVTLKNAVILTCGTWNRRHFDIDDLDSIVAAFNALGMSGRVPLKFGHNAEQDGQPALGWITRIARDGDRLVADMEVAAEVAKAIKSGLYRFTSVELLVDARSVDGTAYPLVLDAVALLGADKPAVRDVSDLRALMTRERAATGLAFSERRTFSMRDETAELRQQLAASTAQLVALTLENAVAGGRILPASREQFCRQHGAKATLSDAVEWIANAPRPQRQLGPAARSTVHDGVLPSTDPVAATREHIRNRFKEDGVRLTFAEAAVEGMRANGDLAERWKGSNGETY